MIAFSSQILASEYSARITYKLSRVVFSAEGTLSRKVRLIAQDANERFGKESVDVALDTWQLLRKLIDPVTSTDVTLGFAHSNALVTTELGCGS